MTCSSAEGYRIGYKTLSDARLERVARTEYLRNGGRDGDRAEWRGFILTSATIKQTANALARPRQTCGLQLWKWLATTCRTRPDDLASGLADGAWECCRLIGSPLYAEQPAFALRVRIHFRTSHITLARRIPQLVRHRIIGRTGGVLCCSRSITATFRSVWDSSRWAPEWVRQRCPTYTPHVGQGTRHHFSLVTEFFRLRFAWAFRIGCSIWNSPASLLADISRLTYTMRGSTSSITKARLAHHPLRDLLQPFPRLRSRHPLIRSGKSFPAHGKFCVPDGVALRYECSHLAPRLRLKNLWTQFQ